MTTETQVRALVRDQMRGDRAASSLGSPGPAAVAAVTRSLGIHDEATIGDLLAYAFGYACGLQARPLHGQVCECHGALMVLGLNDGMDEDATRTHPGDVLA